MTCLKPDRARLAPELRARLKCTPQEIYGTAEELIGFLKAKRVASFKPPERLEIVAEFPTSPVGKILKRELRERIAAKLAEERKA